MKTKQQQQQKKNNSINNRIKDAARCTTNLLEQCLWRVQLTAFVALRALRKRFQRVELCYCFEDTYNLNKVQQRNAL